VAHARPGPSRGAHRRRPELAPSERCPSRLSPRRDSQVYLAPGSTASHASRRATSPPRLAGLHRATTRTETRIVGKILCRANIGAVGIAREPDAHLRPDPTSPAYDVGIGCERGLPSGPALHVARRMVRSRHLRVPAPDDQARFDTAAARHCLTPQGTTPRSRSRPSGVEPYVRRGATCGRGSSSRRRYCCPRPDRAIG
jgi:hypothetical protein